MEWQANNGAAADGDLVERAVEVTVRRLGFSREGARERLARNAAALELDLYELALLVLSGQPGRSRHITMPVSPAS